MTWVDLSGAFGYGTKLTSTQMQNLRDNIAAMAAGDAGAPEIVEAALGAAAVAQTILKSAMSEVSVSVPGESIAVTAALPGGEYGFAPQTKGATTDVNFHGLADLALTASYATPGAYFTNDDAAAHLGYAQQRYITASGEVFWIFILRDKITKEISDVWCAPDHPCMGFGGNPEAMPHPFQKKYDPVKNEIVLINPSEAELKEMYAKQTDCLIDVILNEYEINELSSPHWPTKEVTIGILNDDWYKRYITGTMVAILKQVIPEVNYVLCKNLKLRAISVEQTL